MHILHFWRIHKSMRFFNDFVQTIQDTAFCLHRNGKRTLFNVLLWVGFVVLGVVVCINSQGSWWYCNRFEFCHTIVHSGFGKIFGVVFADLFLLCILVTIVALEEKWAVYVLECVACFYFGANAFVCVAEFSFLGVLYLVAYFVTTLLGKLLMCCIAKQSQWYFGKGLFNGCKRLILTTFVLFLLQFVGLFLFLGSITALI